MKAGVALGVGVLGAAAMAAVDKPASRKELFQQAAVAGVSTVIFGPTAVRIADHYADFVDLSTLSGIEVLEWSIPILFLVGALSWGAVGALVTFRRLIRERAGHKAFDAITKD